MGDAGPVLAYEPTAMNGSGRVLIQRRDDGVRIVARMSGVGRVMVAFYLSVAIACLAGCVAFVAWFVTTSTRPR